MVLFILKRSLVLFRSVPSALHISSLFSCLLSSPGYRVVIKCVDPEPNSLGSNLPPAAYQLGDLGSVILFLCFLACTWTS